ncbi:MAG: hypothetical protein UHU21_02795 [Lachnospiraceae bacterium]|nr:hypothetical protein [Lachnospiraceae bacterium]
MNNIIKRKWNKNSMVIIEDLQGMAFQAESGGHTFQISGIDGEGNAVALSGTPAGVMLRADGQDVTLTCSVSGGVVSATLPANAYSVPGRFGLTIFLTSDGQKTAIYAAVGTVGKTSSGTVAPPAGSDVVDLVNAIATAVTTIPASYTDLMASVAPTYSSSGLYAVGSYAWYNGKLYRCTTPITSGETWTSGHWTLANLGSDLVDLKSALSSAGILTIAGSFDDISTSKTIANITGINFSSLTFFEFTDNIGNEDVVVKFYLADSTAKYVNLRNKTTYAYSSNITGVKVYAEANHLTKTFDVNGVFYSGEGIVSLLSYIDSSCFIEMENLVDNPRSVGGLHGTTTVNNGVYTLTSNNDGGTPRSTIKAEKNLVSGHEYYYHVEITPTNKTPTSLVLQTMYGYSDIKVVTAGIKIGKIVQMDGKYTAVNTDSILSVVAEYSNSEDAVLSFTNFYFVDLTESNISEDYARAMREIGGSYRVEDTPLLLKNVSDKISNTETLQVADARFAKWKMFTFESATRRLITLGSDDGINWRTISTSSHKPTTGTCLRDPAVVKHGQYYYMVYSRILNDTPYSQDYSTGPYIGLARSLDLLEWEELTPIEISGYSDMWAPEWVKNSDGSYWIVLSCSDGETTTGRYIPVTSFEPFTYGEIQNLSLTGTPEYMIDLDINWYKGDRYLSYCAGNKIRFAKEINGVFTSYSAVADWYNDNCEGSFLVQMDGFVRIYLAYHQNANSIYYADSSDMINWSSVKPCNLPYSALQHAGLLYNDEWICNRLNILG